MILNREPYNNLELCFTTDKLVSPSDATWEEKELIRASLGGVVTVLTGVVLGVMVEVSVGMEGGTIVIPYGVCSAKFWV